MCVDKKTLTIVGSAGSGKTALFNYMHRKHFNRESFVQGTDFTIMLRVDGTPVQMTVFDNSSLDSYFGVRRLTYVSADVVLVTFSLASRASFEEMISKWYPEARSTAQEVASFIVVGTKMDIRDDDLLASEGGDFVRREEGLAYAKKVKASAYVECSSLRGDSVSELFESAAKTAMNNNDGFLRNLCHIL